MAELDVAKIPEAHGGGVLSLTSCFTTPSPSRNLRRNAKREIAAQAVVVGHKWPSVSAACKMVHTPCSVSTEWSKNHAN